MSGPAGKRFLWRIFLSELIGTALLVFAGLSVVIFMWGSGSPVALVLPHEGLRRLINGFLFGAIGALIALSPVGRVSGAHINPVVTMGFWLMRKLDPRVSLVYVFGQLAGACAGALPLLVWGSMGRSVAFGATLPGKGFTTMIVLYGEVVTTFTMVSLLVIFLGFREIRRFTPALFPPLYAFMVWAEAPISGTGTNPARSLGPALISGEWQGWWIFWLGPLLGSLLALSACSFLAKRIEVAKLYYFDSDRDGLFRRMGRSDQRGRKEYAAAAK